MVQKRKWKFNKDWSRDFAWIAKLPDNGMAQCNLCAMDVSISSGGRTDVRRHQESPRHAKLAKSKGSTKGGMVQCVAHGQNEVDGVTRAEPCAKRRRVDQPIAPGGDLFDFLDADEPITTGVAGSSESEVEEYLAQPPPPWENKRPSAILANAWKKMAKSSYLSFEISYHSGVISSCGAFVQHCRQGRPSDQSVHRCRTNASRSWCSSGATSEQWTCTMGRW